MNATVRNAKASADLITRLCSSCGMCCNGVLFADARVVSGREAESLRLLGIELAGRTRLRLPQPCACFDGRFCRIYSSRPGRCVQFECGVLKRVQDGKMRESAGQKRIAQARAKVERVRRWLHRSGESDENSPLTKRYARVIAQPLDLTAGGNAVAVRGKLMRAMADLMQFLHREFLS